MQHNLLYYLIIAGASITITACSFSYSSNSSSQSSKSISDSVSSIISSPSKSSNSSDEGDAFQNEVTDYTVAYVKSSHANYASFQKGLSEIASQQGIVNWENDPKTYIAIGRALKKAKLEGRAYETYKYNLSGGDYARMRDIQEGYNFR